MHLKNHRDVRFAQDRPFEVAVQVPRRGFRHVVTPEQLQRVFALIPEWDRVSRGLRGVVLADGSDERESYYRRGYTLLHLLLRELGRHVEARGSSGAALSARETANGRGSPAWAAGRAW